MHFGCLSCSRTNIQPSGITNRPDGHGAFRLYQESTMIKPSHPFAEKLHDNSAADNVIGWVCCIGLVVCLILNSAGYLGVN